MAKPGEDGGLTQEEVAKALKKAARQMAKKTLRKAFGIPDGTKLKDGLRAHFEGLIKTAIADRPTKAEVTAADEAVLNGVVEMIAKGPLEEKDVTKTSAADGVIRLVADDAGKTGEGEGEDEEAKTLRKTISDAQDRLAKRAKGTGDSHGEKRAVSNDL